jgi:hypothetical protein
MTRQDVLKHLCQTVGLVYQTLGNFTQPSDGFCSDCPAQQGRGWTFNHSGETLDYVRVAVLEKLVRDGYTPKVELLRND